MISSDHTLAGSISYARVNVLGVGIAPLNLRAAVEISARRIRAGERHHAHFCNVHVVMEALADERLRRVLNDSGLTAPDGMPLVWLLRRAGFRDAGRVYGPDFLLALCERGVADGLRHYFYGGGPGVAERLARALVRRIPELQVVGVCTPPFRPAGVLEDAAVLQQINAARPDVVWVGLGTPKQDFWVAQHRPSLDAPLLAAVGAAFDFHSGTVPQAPLWMQRRGLEWLYRLCREPRRLWFRYLVYNPLFLFHVALQASGVRRYEIDDNDPGRQP